VAPMVRVMGYGIPFSEGDQWKRKRRIINEVFNFEFLKSKIKTMEHLCSKAIKDI
jgi:cytochrome P450